MVDSTLRLAYSLKVTGANLVFTQALGANTGIIVYGNFGTQGPHTGRFTDFTLTSCGSLCTGSLLQLEGAVGYTIANGLITEHGGRGINNLNSERVTIESNVEITAVARPIVWAGNSNESRISAKITSGGLVNVVGTAPFAVWSRNSNSSNQYPCPYSEAAFYPNLYTTFWRSYCRVA